MRKFLFALALAALTGLFAAAAADDCGHYTWQLSNRYESKDNTTHKILCLHPGCDGFIEEQHTYDGNYLADERYHILPCTKCGDTENSFKNVHLFFFYYYVNDEQHKANCYTKGCPYVKYEPHDMEVSSLEGGRHNFRCFAPNCMHSYDESCTYGAWGKYDDDNHARYCQTVDCVNVDIQPHTFAHYLASDESNHYYFCTLCDERKGVTAHDMSVYTSLDGGRHLISCAAEGCNYLGYEDCAPATLLCGAATKCAKCENMVSSAYADHDYEQRHDNANHWRVCLRAGCTYSDTPGAHNISYESLDDSEHKASCATCPYNYTENHSLTLQNDETGHWEECFCEYVTPKEAHDMLYVDCGVKYACSVCARESLLPAEHVWETTTIAPECAQNGSIVVKCAVCHDESVTLIAKRGHHFGDWAHVGAGAHEAMCRRCDFEMTRDCAVTQIEGVGEMCLICGASETLTPVRVTDWRFTLKRGNIGDLCLWYFEDFDMLAWMVEFGGECAVNTGEYSFVYRLPGEESETEINVITESDWHSCIFSNNNM